MIAAPATPLLFTSQVSARAFDGLLVVEPENTLDMLTALHREGLPVVLVDDRGHHPEFPSVTAANTEGGAAAARHLLAAGRRRPLVLTGPLRFGCVRDRLAGFRAACAEHGVGVDLVVEGDFTEADGRATVRRLLAEGREFDAVFAHNDLAAGNSRGRTRRRSSTTSPQRASTARSGGSSEPARRWARSTGSPRRTSTPPTTSARRTAASS
jgi:LacI family transcriptional regulator